MARIRTIKPEFFKHGDLYLTEKRTGLPIRLAFAGLWTVVDREGRFKWKPMDIKPDVLPHDPIYFEDVLNALEEDGFIIKYEVDGKEYGCIPSFSEHQNVNSKEAQSKLPAPPRNASESIEIPVPTDEDTEKKTGKGKEQGKEGKGKESLSSANADLAECYSLWNDFSQEVGLPSARQVKSTDDKLTLRLKEHGLDGFGAALNGIRGSPHHRGENDRGWRADLPWLAKRENFEKMMLKGEHYGRTGDVERPANTGSPTIRALAEYLSEGAEIEPDDGTLAGGDEPGGARGGRAGLPRLSGGTG